jgi:hypothetical protein
MSILPQAASPVKPAASLDARDFAFPEPSSKPKRAPDYKIPGEKRKPQTKRRLQAESKPIKDKRDPGKPLQDCPTCGRPMFAKVNYKTGFPFAGCSGFPNDCRKTLPLEKQGPRKPN